VERIIGTGKSQVYLCAKIGLVGVEEVGKREAPHGVPGRLACNTDRDGLDAKSRGGNFCEQSVRRGPDRDVIEPSVNDHESDASLDRFGRSCGSKATAQKQDNSEKHGAPKGEIATSDAVDQPP
jgi:hypothetical protein